MRNVRIILFQQKNKETSLGIKIIRNFFVYFNVLEQIIQKFIQELLSIKAYKQEHEQSSEEKSSEVKDGENGGKDLNINMKKIYHQ